MKIFLISFIKFIMKVFLAFPIWIIIIAISPFIVIRFIRIPSYSFGGSVLAPEIYLCCKKEFGTGKFFDIFYYHNGYIVNSFLAKKQKKLLNIFQPALYLDEFNKTYLKLKKHQYDIINDCYLKHPDLLRKYDSQFKLTDNEKLLGESLFEEMGIPVGAKIVCFYNRDSLFVKDVIAKENPKANYTEEEWRNGNLDNYIPAAEYLANKGYYLFRMGKIAAQKIPNNHKNIIDYTFSSFRSDFLDFYIFYKASFSFGDATGISFLATLFRKPVVYCNVYPFYDLYYANIAFHDLFIPQKIKLNKNKCFLSFKEIMDLRKDINFYDRKNLYGTISSIHNSSKEILEAVKEMEQALQNSKNIPHFVYTNYEEKYINILKNYYSLESLMKAKISHYFLKQLDLEG